MRTARTNVRSLVVPTAASLTEQGLGFADSIVAPRPPTVEIHVTLKGRAVAVAVGLRGKPDGGAAAVPRREGRPHGAARTATQSARRAARRKPGRGEGAVCRAEKQYRPRRTTPEGRLGA